MAMPVVWSPCAGRGIGATPAGLGHRVGDRAAAEERRHVEAGPGGVGPDEAVARQRRVHDAAAAAVDRGGVEAVALLAVRQQVAQEDIGAVDQPAHDLRSVGAVEGDGDRALAPVVHVERVVDVRRALGLARHVAHDVARRAARPSRRPHPCRRARRRRSARPSSSRSRRPARRPAVRSITSAMRCSLGGFASRRLYGAPSAPVVPSARRPEGQVLSRLGCVGSNEVSGEPTFPSGVLGTPIPHVMDRPVVMTLFTTQHSVASSAQLRALGVTRTSVSRACSSGTLEVVHRGVYRLGGSTPGFEGEVLALQLFAGARRVPQRSDRRRAPRAAGHAAEPDRGHRQREPPRRSPAAASPRANQLVRRGPRRRDAHRRHQGGDTAAPALRPRSPLQRSSLRRVPPKICGTRAS